MKDGQRDDPTTSGCGQQEAVTADRASEVETDASASRVYRQGGYEREVLSSTADVSVLAAGVDADRRRWDDLVSRSPSGDVYFRPSYARAHEAIGHGTAVALHATVPGGAFLVPLVVRELRDLPFAQHVRGVDALTPYGIGGVLPLGRVAESPELYAALFEVLRAWCAQNAVVSVLLRLHPLLEQRRWIEAAIAGDRGLNLRPIGPTVAIAVMDWTESRMDRNRRYNLRLAKRTLHATRSGAGATDVAAPAMGRALALFERIYAQTMDRLGAPAFYYFSEHYLETLAAELPDRVGVAIAWLGEEPVAADLFFFDGDFAHCHLSGTTEVGRERGAATLLVREGVDWAMARGCRFLHLGGGRGGEDALLRFKQGFGGGRFDYAVVELVADEARYAALAAARRACCGAPPRPEYFPEYRA